MGNLRSKERLTILTMFETLKVSSKGQIVIPEKIRTRLKIKQGEKLILIEKKNKIILEREKNFLEELESLRWLKLTEQSLKEFWDNPKDEKIGRINKKTFVQVIKKLNSIFICK